MNLNQLEAITRQIEAIGNMIEDDPMGLMAVQDALRELHRQVIQQMRDLVWKAYLEARKG